MLSYRDTGKDTTVTFGDIIDKSHEVSSDKYPYICKVAASFEVIILTQSLVDTKTDKDKLSESFRKLPIFALDKKSDIYLDHLEEDCKAYWMVVDPSENLDLTEEPDV